MRSRLRRGLLWAHLVVGIGASPVLLVLGLSGALLAFERPLDDALNDRLSVVTPSGAPLPLAALEANAVAARPGWKPIGAVLPEDARHAVIVSVARADDEADALYVDPYSGRVLGSDAEASRALGWIHRLHTHLGQGQIGATVVAWGAVALVFLASSGLILWWPRRILAVRGGSTRRRLTDLHSAVGVWANALLLVLASTGGVIHWEPWAQRAIGWLIGSATAPHVMVAEPSASTDCRGRPRLPSDVLLAAARAAAPGARATYLELEDDGHARVVLKYPEDRTPRGRTIVSVESCTAAIARVQDARRAPPAWRLTRVWNRSIHTGDVLGWPTRILACAGSLSLPILALSGPILFGLRRRRRARSVASARDPG